MLCVNEGNFFDQANRPAQIGDQPGQRGQASTCIAAGMVRTYRKYARTYNVRTYVRAWVAGGNDELPSSSASTSPCAYFVVRTYAYVRMHGMRAQASKCTYVRAHVRAYVGTCVRTYVRMYVTRRVGMMSFRHPPPPHLLSPLSLCVRACARTCVGMHARHARADVQVYART